jgi:hypothetical protein
MYLGKKVAKIKYMKINTNTLQIHENTAHVNTFKTSYFEEKNV